MTPTADGFRLHLGPSHPLARIAGERCTHLTPQVGGVACGECWESAIRDDERFVVENDLPREVGDQDDGVDEVAVERAVAGEPMHLTRQEQRIAIAALLRYGKRPAYISRVLRMNHSTVLREVQNLARTAA
jgi:hypothetical protein